MSVPKRQNEPFYNRVRIFRKTCMDHKAPNQDNRKNQSINSIDQTAARSRKILARIYYQLKSGHAFTGAYMHRIEKIDTHKRNHCSGSFRLTVQHLALECRKWRCERDDIWEMIRLDGSGLHKGQSESKTLFGDSKATRAIMQFLKATRMGQRPNYVLEENREYDMRYNLGIEDLDIGEAPDVRNVEEIEE